VWSRTRLFFFFFQAEDGIRDLTVTGVQTCALPILAVPDKSRIEAAHLCGLPVAPVMLQRLDLWQQRLQADGIAFADLRPALQTQEQAQPVFFRTDVHMRSEEHTSELQSQSNLVCRLLLEKKKTTKNV